MATTIIGIGIGFIIATLAIDQGSVTHCGFSVLPFLTVAGMLIGIILMTTSLLAPDLPAGHVTHSKMHIAARTKLANPNGLRVYKFKYPVPGQLASVA